MKKFFKFLGIVFILAVVAIAAVFYFTSDLSQTADDFFKSIKNNDYTKAQEYLSSNFKQNTPVDALKRAFPYARFKHYSGCSFSNREVNADGVGKLKGSIEFDDGSKLPVTIQLIKENDKWRINYIVLSPSGLSTSSPNNQPQKTESYPELVHKTMVELASAIKSNYYSNFYSSTSEEFRRSVTIDKLKAVFSRFSSVGINWDDIRNLRPVITRKEIENNGVLKILGYYPTTPRHLEFDFEYLKNNGQYRIFGVFLRLGKQ